MIVEAHEKGDLGLSGLFLGLDFTLESNMEIIAVLIEFLFFDDFQGVDLLGLVIHAFINGSEGSVTKQILERVGISTFFKLFHNLFIKELY